MKHIHHIIPKHMGGTDEKNNLIEVTIEEHAELHRQLWKEFAHWEDELAWKGLSKMISKQEIISKVISETHKGKKVSEDTRKKMSEASPWKGKKRSKDTIQKMSEARKGKKLSADHVEKMKEIFSGEGNPMYGRTHSEDSRRKISMARQRTKGKKRGPYKGKKNYSDSHMKVLKRNGQ
jgi:hypothetical protein